MSGKPLVGIVMGSDTDLPVMTETAQTLKKFGVPFEIEITSAHRSPARTSEYARTAHRTRAEGDHRGRRRSVAPGRHHRRRDHAAGDWRSHRHHAAAGLDALLSTVQMPGGVPVACTAIGKPGAINAAIFAAEIIAASDPALARRLRQFKEKLARSVAEKSEKVKKEFAVLRKHHENTKDTKEHEVFLVGLCALCAFVVQRAIGTTAPPRCAADR